MYIVFEGIDGSGKDTQLNKTFEYLLKKDKYLHIARLREPSNKTEASILIKEKLKLGFESPEEAFDLYMKDKEELKIIREKILETKTIILQSRSYFSTYGYQCAMGLDFEYAHKGIQNAFNNGNLDIPNIIFYFDVSPEESLKRIGNRGESKEIFETYDFLIKAREMYIKAINEKCLGYENIIIIDANVSMNEVWEQVKIILDKYFT